MTGGSGIDRFETNTEARFLKNLSINLGGDADVVLIASGLGRSTVDGSLFVSTGDGVDLVTLDGISVSKHTRIVTGADGDTLTITFGNFGDTFVADLGSGDDSIFVAHTTDGSAPVTFQGQADIDAGTGDDTLRLGRSESAGGGEDSRTIFEAAGNEITGGSGVNLFDDEFAAFSGVIVGTDVINWQDPTP